MREEEVQAREAATSAAVRAACTAADIHLKCTYPDCSCEAFPAEIKAAIPAYLAKLTSTKAEPSRIAGVRVLAHRQLRSARDDGFLDLSPLAEYIEALESNITAIEAELTAQKAAHAKMLRDEADIFDSGLEPNDHIGGELAEMLRRLADKIEGGE